MPWTHTPRWTHTPCWCDGPPEQYTNLTRLMQHSPLASRQFGVVLTLHASDSVTIGVGHTRSLCGCVAVYIVKHCIHICAAIGIGFSLGWFFEVLGSIDISCTLCHGHGCLCAWSICSLALNQARICLPGNCLSNSNQCTAFYGRICSPSLPPHPTFPLQTVPSSLWARFCLGLQVVISECYAPPRRRCLCKSTNPKPKKQQYQSRAQE